MKPAFVLTGLLLTAVTLGVLAGCHALFSADPPAAAPAPVCVAAARPERKTLRRESVEPGQIEAFEQTPLFVKFPAYVEKLYVNIGDRVQANQLLVNLFLPELADELRQKEAALVQAEAEIGLAAAAVRAAEAAVATARANVDAAEAGKVRADADYARWQSQLARISQLVAGGSLDRKLEDETRDSLKAAEAARAEAQAKVLSAQATLLQAQADVAKAQANEAVARARRSSAQAEAARVKTLIGYRQVRAPYAGVVTQRNVVRGDFVQPATTATAKSLLTVARTDQVRIFVDVPETDSPWVEPGRDGSIGIEALAERSWNGKVTRTSWVLGANRTLRTELDLPNPDGLLRPGMYVTAKIVLQERPNVIVLPLAAIVREGKQAFCWVVKDGKAARIPIGLGLQGGSDVEVASGLGEDDLVVQSQVAALREGLPVEPFGVR